MKIGIIAEGKADLAVITNILKGVLDIDRSDILYIQPENYLDETDLSSYNYQININQFSNWELVLKQCVEKDKIIDFFDNPIEDERFLVIQIDTAESELKNYGVIKPTKKGNQNYPEEMRGVVASKIDSLIENVSYKIFYAICVEETDAWVLTIYSNDSKDTSFFNNPKEKLHEIILKDKKLSKLSKLSTYEKYYELSKFFRKNKDLNKFILKNKSLEIFCSDLQKQKKDYY
jgi:hypothetical protein